MSEAAPHKSHATGWIISVVLALVFYVGSAYPVLLSFDSPKGPWLPDSWEKPVESFYEPAIWLWTFSFLNKFDREWRNYWAPILDIQEYNP